MNWLEESSDFRQIVFVTHNIAEWVDANRRIIYYDHTVTTPLISPTQSIPPDECILCRLPKTFQISNSLLEKSKRKHIF